MHFEKSFGKGSYYYFGDNTGKDFITLNKLGWTTISLLDHNEVNIHPQDFELPYEYLPKFKVDKLSDLFNFI